jgi:hypothetical protein
MSAVDFPGAAKRHWGDAGYLLMDQRLPNADQLFGISAERALKAVMVGLDMALRADGAPEAKRHRVHIDELWDEFLTFAASRGGARYAAHLSTVNNPFFDWDVGQRYAPDSTILVNQVQKHQLGALLTQQCLTAAILDGVI